MVTTSIFTQPDRATAAAEVASLRAHAARLREQAEALQVQLDDYASTATPDELENVTETALDIQAARTYADRLDAEAAELDRLSPVGPRGLAKIRFVVFLTSLVARLRDEAECADFGAGHAAWHYKEPYSWWDSVIVRSRAVRAELAIVRQELAEARRLRREARQRDRRRAGDR